VFEILLKNDERPEPEYDMSILAGSATRRSRRGDLLVVMSLEPHHQCGNQGAGQDVRSHDSKHDSLGERHKEITRDSGKKEHRNKNNADTKSGDQRG
jgi:hypothetical protein